MNLDLNLLRILPVLAQTSSVTRAAHLLGMSQSGLSSALSRLRGQLGDPLFVQTNSGMQPTDLAQRLISTASHMVAQIERDLEETATLAPEMLEQEFVISMGDAAEPTILPPLIQRMRREHAGANVRSVTLEPEELPARMGDGSVEVAVGFYPELEQDSFHRQTLYEQTFVCLVAADHQVRSDELTWDEFTSYGHVAVASHSRSMPLFEKALRTQGHNRRIVLRTQHLLSLPFIVEVTDFIATVPLSLALLLAKSNRVRIVKPPFNPPVFTVHQYWHSRFDGQPRSRWLRRNIAALSSERSKWLERIEYFAAASGEAGVTEDGRS
ncbi:hypothetical protein L288_14690 [Sphingobium quisquiliarum P25]|uniref:HTH lysR-type domain-containing protein n=1 Tax=Sphingobium quisquiliarum P25 TaxID=1329909 RepID=T0I2J6_9SPHN|nr:LysR substrate-binding domain-containing protein [Sphingobium quisquiliarum]EQB03844.1 hypothetical protein L288_14690 [Sphingobium quisquiliarum P25]